MGRKHGTILCSSAFKTELALVIIWLCLCMDSNWLWVSISVPRPSILLSRQTIACANVCYILDYAYSILTGNNHNIPRQFPTHCIGFQFGIESIINWLLLSTVHSNPVLNTCHLYYIPTLHRVRRRQLRSAPLNLLSCNLDRISALLSPLVVFGILQPLPLSLELPSSSVDSYTAF